MPNAVQQSSFQMINNVDYILNPNSRVEDAFKPAFKIASRPTYGYYSMKCKFFGITKDEKQHFEFEPFNIKLLNIKQSFIDSFADEITLIIECTPVQLLMLYDNFKDLKVTIQLFECSTKEEKVNDKPSLTKTFRVAFKDKSDIRKIIPKNAMIPTDTHTTTQGHSDQYVSVEFQLIEDVVYHIRHKAMNYIVHNCKVKDLILNCCSLFKINKVSFVEPDNTEEYQNVIIPPLLTFEQVFTYINNYFGVYNKGFTFYYTGDILYIYPTYDATIKTPTIVNFYNVGSSQYSGMEVYHAVDEDDNNHVIINSEIFTTNLQDIGSDNIGTHFIGFDVDHVIDNTSHMKESKTTELARAGTGPMVVTRLKTYMQSSGLDDAGITFNVYKPQYVFDWNNKYIIPGMIASYRGSLINFKWTSAVPFSITPGHGIRYHYDTEITSKRGQNVYTADNYKYDTRSGICLGVEYRLEQLGRYVNNLVFSSTASVTCFLDKETVITKEEVDTVAKANADSGVIRL